MKSFSRGFLILGFLLATCCAGQAQAQLVTVKCSNSFRGSKSARPSGIERRHCIVPLTVELTTYQHIPLQLEGYARQDGVLWQGNISSLQAADDIGAVPMKVHGVDDDPVALRILATGCTLTSTKATVVRAYVPDMAWLDPAPATEITVKNFWSCR